jgi:hypothetical protein
MITRLVSTLACAAGLLTGLIAAAPIAPERIRLEAPLGSASKAAASRGEPDAVEFSERPNTGDRSSAPRALTPRIVRPKVASKYIELPVHQVTGAATWNGRLIVKFRDDLRARADVIPSMFVRNGAGEPIPEVTELLSHFDGTIRSVSRRAPEEQRALEARAELRTGQAQPDMASLSFVDVRPEQLLAAARAFNELDIVEFVEIQSTEEQHRQNFSSQFGCGAAGENSPLTAGINNCFTASRPPQVNAPRCSALGGGGGCNAPQICEADIVLPECRAGCNDAQCCNLISGCLPGCSEVENNQGWDALCATYANVLCAQYGSIYDGGPPRGSPDGTPDFYKYDPCFAMRGAIFQSPATEGGPVVIQGQVVAPDTPNLVSGGLMAYTLDPNTGQFVPGTDRLDAVNYPSLNITDEANPDTGVPQRAAPDPSLEGGGALLAGGCFTPHASGGCNQVTCCVYVCRNDPACCIIEWDDNCVTLATNAPEPAPGSEGALLGLSSPCTTNKLPTTPGAAPDSGFPPSGPTPLLTAGREVFPSGQLGSTRGYQTYTESQPVLDPFTAPTALVPPQIYPVPAPTQPSTDVPDPTRANRAGNLGTLAWLNSGYRGGGLDLSGYDELLGQLGVNAATRGHGQSVKIAVIDRSAYLEHEDLKNVIRAEPGQTQILIDQDPMDPNHGTAVLGVIAAERNDFGITGIAYGSTVTFYPSVSVEESERLVNAIQAAILDMGEGDILCLPIGVGGNTIVSSPTVNAWVRFAESLGIITICSAGNGGVAINPGAQDSGAIIVSACWPGYRIGTAPAFSAVPGGNGAGGLPGFNYCRFQQSNYDPAELLPNAPPPSTVSGWGTGVTTCGYGDLFRGDSPSSDPLQVDRLRTYTSGQSFEGTSAACAMITGWCARLQSFVKTFYGIPLSPLQMRSALQANGNFFQQCGLPYGADLFPGYPENCEQFGDVVAGGEAARIGGFPRTRNTVSWIIANTFSSEPNPVSFTIITGALEGGTQYSIRAPDNNSLKIGSLQRRAGNRGQGFGAPLLYPATGATTDVQFTGSTARAPAEVNSFGLRFRSRVTWPTPVTAIVYFYNFRQNRWVVSWGGGLSSAPFFTPPEDDWGVIATPAGNPQEFLSPNGSGGSLVQARIYTLGPVPGVSYSVLYDTAVLTFDVDVFGPPEGGGGGGFGGGFGGGGGGGG